MRTCSTKHHDSHTINLNASLSLTRLQEERNTCTQKNHTLDSRHFKNLENQPSKTNSSSSTSTPPHHPSSSAGGSIPPAQLPAPHPPIQRPAAPHVQLWPPSPQAAAASAVAAPCARLRSWRCRPSTRTFRPRRISGRCATLCYLKA